MKTQNYSKHLLTALALVMSSAAFAQADSGDVPPLRGNPRVLPLSMQERETPVVNNTTVQQITQTMNTYSQTSSGWSGGQVSDAYASCGSNKLLSGATGCNGNGGFAGVMANHQNGNGWYGSCSALYPAFQPTTTVTVICGY